jgi:hypothetical protein
MFLLSLPDRSLAWFPPLFVGYIALAFPLGLLAVATERRGNRWRVWPRRLHVQTIGPAHVHERLRTSFGSPSAAQFWYEWNCHGWDVPGYVGIVFLMIWVMLLFVRGENVLWLPPIVGLLVGLPVVLAGAVSPGLARFKPFRVKDQGFMTFVAIRPHTSGQIVRAKFVMAAWSALLTWVISIALAIFWILLSGNLDRLLKLAKATLGAFPANRTAAIAGLGTVALLTLTWKQMTDGLAAGLTGRRWIGALPSGIYLAGVVILISAGLWVVNHPEWLSWLFFIVSVCLVLGAVIKCALVIVAFRAVLHGQLMTWRAIIGVLGLWLITTGCWLGLVALLVPIPSPSVTVSWPVLIAGVGFFVPLVRFPLSTLAVEWNRHR